MSHRISRNPIEDGLAECIASYVAEKHGLLIGLSTATELGDACRGQARSGVGAAGPPTVVGTGVDATTPTKIEVDSEALNRYVDERLLALPLSVEARAVLTSSRDLASTLHHSYVGQEHVVAALAVVERARLAPEVEQAIVEAHKTLAPYLQERPKAPSCFPGWTPRAVRAVTLALRDADGDVTVGNLVVGVVADGEGLGQALVQAGLTLEKVRAMCA